MYSIITGFVGVFFTSILVTLPPEASLPLFFSFVITPVLVGLTLGAAEAKRESRVLVLTGVSFPLGDVYTMEVLVSSNWGVRIDC